MEPLYQIVLTSITGFLTFLLGLRKGKAETEGVLLQNLEKSIQIYQVIVDDMKEQIKDLNGKIDDLENKLEHLVQENAELKRLMKEHDAFAHSKNQ